MKREEIRPYQLAQLELLSYADRFCKAHDLTYFLIWGTLLGAVREQGFIPWDADVDIAMPRADYDRFCSLMLRANGTGPVFLDHYASNPRHLSPHAILRIRGTHVRTVFHGDVPPDSENDGIYLDVFPLDGVSSDPEKQRRQCARLARIERFIELRIGRIYKENAPGKAAVKKLVAALFRLVPLKILHRRAERISRCEGGTEYLALLSDPLFFPGQTFPRACFAPGRTCTFEGRTFPVPKDAEQVLEIMYGDYMSPPPEEGRYELTDNVILSVDYGDLGAHLKL